MEEIRVKKTSDGYIRLIRISGAGVYCGYIGLPDDRHKWFGLNYEDLIFVRVHGGVTFADAKFPGDDVTAMNLSVLTAGEVVPWWVGFDCAHGGDYVPGRSRSSRHETHGLRLWSWSQVDYELDRLLDQARKDVVDE